MDMDNSTGQVQEMINGQSMMLNICTKKPRPQQAAEHSLKCPRCESTNTKFCYYNNYSLSQPRYFCKSCRRYWTKGGTLRNVPVGGGCRKNHKIIRSSKRSSSSSLSNQSELSDTITNSNSNPNPNFNIPPLTYDHHDQSNHDLTLAFARLQNNFGNPSSVYADNFITNPNSTQGFLGFVDHHGTQNNFNQNLYLGIDHADNINNNNNIGGEIMQLQSNYGDNQEVNYMTNNVGMKQDIIISNGENYENGKVLFGFPWQNGEIINLDSGKDTTQSWINNTRGLNYWHGLINSPLM